MRRIMVLVTVALGMAALMTLSAFARYGSELGEPASWASHRERKP